MQKSWVRNIKTAVPKKNSLEGEAGRNLEVIAHHVNHTSDVMRNLAPSTPEVTLAIRSLQQAYSWCRLAIETYSLEDVPDPTQTLIVPCGTTPEGHIIKGGD